METRYIINAAGVSAQAVHDMAAPHKFTIQPTRGEYYLLDKSEGSRVHHVIFQCPNENGKGVLVAPTVHGNLIVGPNADPVEGDNTACTAAGLAFVSAAARRSVPNIRFSESIRNFAGVRANVDTGDFVIGEAEGAHHRADYHEGACRRVDDSEQPYLPETRFDVFQTLELHFSVFLFGL